MDINQCHNIFSNLPELIYYKPCKRAENGKYIGSKYIVKFTLPFVKRKVAHQSTSNPEKTNIYKLIQAIKIKYQLLEYYPQALHLANITSIQVFKTVFYQEQIALIKNLAIIDCIPETPELFDMNAQDFPESITELENLQLNKSITNINADLLTSYNSIFAPLISDVINTANQPNAIQQFQYKIPCPYCKTLLYRAEFNIHCVDCIESTGAVALE